MERVKSIFIGILILITTSIFAVTLVWCPSPSTDVVIGYKVWYGTGQITNWQPQIIQLINTNDPCNFVVVSSGSNWFTNYNVFVDAGTNTTYIFTNLIPGKTYYFVATAYDTNGIESLPSNEVSYTVPPPTIVIYLGLKLEWWTNMSYFNKRFFNLMSFTNPPNPQFYRTYLLITNRWNNPANIIDLKTRLEWWTNIAYINRQTFDLVSFTNPPYRQFYRSSLVVTNQPF